jgi:subtilisin family serine protease
MKNILRIILLFSLILGGLLIPVLPDPVQAQHSQDGDQAEQEGNTLFVPMSINGTSSPEHALDLIVEIDGSRQAVIDRVKALGGTVHNTYANVPALAVAIPPGKLQELTSSQGVVRIEKDRLISLGEPPYGKSNPFGSFPVQVKVSDKVKVKPLANNEDRLDPAPQGFANTIYTGAQEVWETTKYGAESVVAVVDSGTAPNKCLSDVVIGSPDYPDGFNATDDGIPANNPANFWHGTFVAGVIASYCELDFSAYPEDPLYLAIYPYLSYPVGAVPILGQAPRAKIYPVKVFPASGEATPISTVLKGLDHILTLKKQGLLDIDVVNLSFGNPTVYDGRNTLDRFVEAMMDANILVVAAAGNSGPIPNSVDSPATSFPGLAVGALDYAPSSRVFYEYLGLTYGTDDKPYNGNEGPGMGLVMRPTDEVRVANFSSRGPTSDGRGTPVISALGSWNFHLGPEDEFYWASGTSFSAPSISGAAALLNSYWEASHGQEPSAVVLRDALLSGADPLLVGPAWKDFNDQGFGALDIPTALDKLIAGASIPAYPVNAGKLKDNVLGPPNQFKTEIYESKTIQVAPGETFDTVFQIGSTTSKVTIEVFDITTPNNSIKAHWPNALEVHVQSAKRSGYSHPASFYWYPYKDKKSFTITIEDGSWSVAKLAWDNQPIERGLMKFSLAGDYSNQNPVSFKVRITRVNEYKRLGERLFKKELKWGDEASVPVEIKPGTKQAVFDLDWSRDWRFYPTSDFDMFIYDPNNNLVSEDGATASAPERVVITDPMPGLWTVFIEATEAYKPDNVQLYVTRQ